MITKDELDRFLQPYGLHVEGAQFLRESQNIVFSHAAMGKKRIVRISKGRYRTLSQVKAELSWILSLAQNGVPVCLPIPAANQEWCLTFESQGENYLVTCFEHAPGRAIEAKDMTESLYRELGRLTAGLHAHAKARGPGLKLLDRPQWHESRLLREDIAKQEDRLTGAFRDSVTDLIRTGQGIPRNARNYGLIHGDVNLGNCFLDQDDLWVFDFDNCEYGYLVQDRATILYDSIYGKVLNGFADASLNERIAPRWAAFQAGYSESGTPEEIQPTQLKTFFLLREAVIYVHYLRILDEQKVGDSFKAGMEIMRQNVEKQEHQVDFERLCAK